MSVEPLLGIVFAILLVFLSAIESAFDALSEVQLRVLASEHGRGPGGWLLKEMIDARQRFLLSLGLSIQLTMVLETIVVSRLFTRLQFEHPLLWSLAVMVLVVILLRQLLPQLLTQNQPERALLLLVSPYAPLYRFLLPVGLTMERLVASFRSEPAPASAESQPDSEEEIQAFIDVGEEEGIIEESEGELIQSIVELGDKRVNEIMTSRAEVLAVPSTATIRAAMEVLIDSPFTRAPVFQGDLDNLEGVVHLQDLLRRWKDGRGEEAVTTVIRPAYFVPETKRAAELLDEMKRSRFHIALVIDEYGGLAGLVTIDDLLQEIVGGIRDEHEGPEPEMVPQPDGSYLVPGDMEIRKLELLFERDLASDDFSTVAGLITSNLHHLPVPGERVELHGLRFEVKQSDARRVLSVLVERSASHQSKDVDAADGNPT